MKLNLLSAILIFTLSGCDKDYDNYPYSKINTPVNTTFRDVFIMDSNTWILCGGENSPGTILRSDDSGENWTISSSPFDNEINCLHFINSDTGFAGDSDILIYKTVNGGLNWNPFYATSWPLTVNRNLRSIWFTNDSTGFVCGGKNLGNGVLYQTNNLGDFWGYSEYAHEYRGICFADEMNGVLCGYGSMLITDDGGATFKIGDGYKSFYTGIALDAAGQYWICDFNGSILKSSDKGNHWKTVRDGSSWKVNGNNLNTIALSPSGNIVCAGPNGFFTWSHDNGQTWNDRESFEGNDILKVKWISDSEFIAVGKNGGVYKVVL